MWTSNAWLRFSIISTLNLVSLLRSDLIKLKLSSTILVNLASPSFLACGILLSIFNLQNLIFMNQSFLFEFRRHFRLQIYHFLYAVFQIRIEIPLIFLEYFLEFIKLFLKKKTLIFKLFPFIFYIGCD